MIQPATPATSPSPSGRLFDSAQHAIREFILRHDLGPGDALPPEARLAQELGIGRASVREAVKALESLGVLETRNGVGLFVRPFSFEPIVANLGYSILSNKSSALELLQVREQLEAGFCERAAACVTPNQLRILRSLVDRMGERTLRGESFAEEDRFFHRALYEAVGNHLLTSLIDVFWSVARRLREENQLAADADPVASWEDHRRIVEALEARDPTAARGAMLQHFRNIERRLASASEASAPKENTK